MDMPVVEDAQARAEPPKRESVETILAEAYPAVHRMAHGLTGEDAIAREVIDKVLARSLRLLPRWRAKVVPSNWFYHHTLLASRGAARTFADVRTDLLVTTSNSTGPAYLAFIAAMRKLPPQQMEALILHHGERLNPRLLGVAMDCSTAAAANHLAAATASLAAIAGGGFDALTATLLGA